MERGRVSFPEYGSTGTPVLSGLMKTSETEDMSMYIAKTYHGLEPVLAQELKELGATGIRISNRAVLFDCTQEVLYKANYLCRTALRILKILKEFWIEKEEDLFEQVHEMAWEKVFPVDATFMVDSSSLDSMFSQSRFVSTQARLAILERFRRVLGQWPDVDSDYYTIRVEVFVRQNHCEVMLDASGMALAHRGYRKPSSEPFNEVLAAGLLKLAQWNPDTDLYVPFCGNGLVAVEAAMQAMAMPAGYYRKGYSFEYWNDFDPRLWKDVKSEAQAAMHDPQGQVWASDPEALVVEKTGEFLKKIRMHQDVDLFLSDFLDSGRPEELAGVAGNLSVLVPMPVSSEGWELDAAAFYEALGKRMKESYPDCRLLVYTTRPGELESSLGLVPEQTFALREALTPALLGVYAPQNLSV